MGTGYEIDVVRYYICCGSTALRSRSVQQDPTPFCPLLLTIISDLSTFNLSSSSSTPRFQESCLCHPVLVIRPPVNDRDTQTSFHTQRRRNNANHLADIASVHFRGDWVLVGFKGCDIVYSGMLVIHPFTVLQP